MPAAVLLEMDLRPRVFRTADIAAARLLAAQLAEAIGAQPPAVAGIACAGAGGRVSYWSRGQDETIGLLARAEGAPALLFFSHPIKALVASLRHADGCELISSEEQAAIGTVRGGPVWSFEICPRCEDHPLHADPVFDDRSRIDGARICNACGTFESLGHGQKAS